MPRKSKKYQPIVVTPDAVALILSNYPGQWFTRKDIAFMLGRKKTSHVIRMIEAATAANLIVRSEGEDLQGRPTYGYTINEMPF